MNSFLELAGAANLISCARVGTETFPESRAISIAGICDQIIKASDADEGCVAEATKTRNMLIAHDWSAQPTIEQYTAFADQFDILDAAMSARVHELRA